jgi:homoserine dehydrogenase
MLGPAMFYGSGAGKLPTASAVVGDIVDMVKHMHTHIILNWDRMPMKLADYKKNETRFFVRTKASKAEISGIFGAVEFIDLPQLADEIGFVTEVMSEEAYEEKAAGLSSRLQMIRFH